MSPRMHRAQAERTFPSQGDKVRFGSFETYVTDIGPRDGPVVLYSHGVPGGLGDAQFVQEELRIRGFRVIAYDRLGHGYSYEVGDDSRREPGFVPVRTQLDAIDEILKARGVPIDAPVIAVGHSWGGGLSLLYAASRPTGRVRALVLISPETESRWRWDPLMALYRVDVLGWFTDAWGLPQCFAEAELERAAAQRGGRAATTTEYSRRFVALTTRSGRQSVINPEECAMSGALASLWRHERGYDPERLRDIPIVFLTAPKDAGGCFTDPAVAVEQHTMATLERGSQWSSLKPEWLVPRADGRGHMQPVTDAEECAAAVLHAAAWATALAEDPHALPPPLPDTLATALTPRIGPE